MEEIKAMDLESKDLVAERVEQMKALFPEIAIEGDGSIDFEKLRLILGDEVEEGDERYAFTWPGKADAIRQSQTVSTATLRPCPEESVDWETTQHLYIEGDNLEVLKLLQRGYHSRIKLIYIDPPYNTNSDFVYEDSFGDPIENYKEQCGLSNQSNANTSGRHHSRWCSFMYSRLKLAWNLLSKDGIILINIDENEYTNLQNLMHEVFGEDNDLGTIVWDKRNPKGDATGISAQHEYIVVYAKFKSNIADKHVLQRPKKNAQAMIDKAKSLFDKISPMYLLMCDKEAIEVQKILPFLSDTWPLCRIGRAVIRASQSCRQSCNKSQCPACGCRSHHSCTHAPQFSRSFPAREWGSVLQRQGACGQCP